MEARVGWGDVVLAWLAYLPVLNLFALVKRRKSRFLAFHALQGLYLISVLGGLFVVFILLFLLFLNVVKAELGQQVFAVLVVMDTFAYVVALVFLWVTIAQRKLFMVPVLGDLAGER